jgi:hypothetical protein
VPTKLGTGPIHDIPPPSVLQNTEQVGFKEQAVSVHRVHGLKDDPVTTA